MAEAVTREGYLVTEKLVKRFDDAVAVDEVSLSIGKGEIFALLGSSGCGKSTLLRMLAGFEKPTSGRILLGGQDVAGMPPYERPVNMMFQSYALFPHLSIWENVAFGLKREGLSKDEVRQRTDEMLGLVQLTPYAQRKPHQLSGGQQQRVALARSLAKRPKLLLLDEPLGALDKKLREQTQFELVNIIEKVGVTVVMVTHDQEEAMTMANRIAIMSKGRVLQVGSPQQIYEYPGNRFVADFIGNVNLFDGKLTLDEADRCAVGTAIGEIHVGHGISGALDMPVAVAVRPEKISIAKQRPTDVDHNLCCRPRQGDRLLRLLQHLHRAHAARHQGEDHRAQRLTPRTARHHLGRRGLLLVGTTSTPSCCATDPHREHTPWPLSIPVPGKRFVIGVPYVWLFVFFLLPFLILLYISFVDMGNDIDPFKPIWGRHDGRAVSSSTRTTGPSSAMAKTARCSRPSTSKPICDRIWYALLTALLCLLLGYPFAYFIARSAPSVRALAADDGDAALLDLLPAARLRLEGHPGGPGRDQQAADVAGPDQRTDPDAVHGRVHAGGHDLRLPALHDPAAVRQSGEDGLPPAGGGLRPGHHALQGLLADHRAAVQGRHRGRLHARVHPGGRWSS